jgi:endoglucanase
MRKESLAFLKELVETPSPSGFEQPVQKAWKEEVSKYADCVRTDLHGNCIAALNEEGAPRIMFAGHCDELGFIVNYISDEGFIHFRTIGGFDVSTIPGRRVRIHTEKGPVLGVLGKKAVHLMKEDERKKAVEAEDLWIDIGAKDKKEAESVVSVGDAATYTYGLEELRGDLVVARGFDDKMGSFVVAEIIRLLAKQKPRAAVFSVSTVQEEVGLRGARTSAFGISPTVGIAVDVTHASDHPKVEKTIAGGTKLGKGPVICRGANINPVVARILTDVAKRKKIPYQMEAAPGGTGTDANAIQLTRAGVAAGLVSVPLRYMHTPVEVLSLKDLDNATKLLAAFVMAVDEKTDFTP